MKSQLSVSGAANGGFFANVMTGGSGEQRRKEGIQRREAKGKNERKHPRTNRRVGAGAEDNIRMNTVLHSQTCKHHLLQRQDFFHSRHRAVMNYEQFA